MGLHISTEGQHCNVLQAEQSQDMDEGALGDSKADDTEAEDGPQDVDVSATLQQVPAATYLWRQNPLSLALTLLSTHPTSTLDHLHPRASTLDFLPVPALLLKLKIHLHLESQPQAHLQPVPIPATPSSCILSSAKGRFVLPLVLLFDLLLLDSMLFPQYPL